MPRPGNPPREGGQRSHELDNVSYGGEEFAKIVADVLALVDRVGEGAGAAEQAAMRERVIATSRYEWMFWDAAWRRETWPV